MVSLTREQIEARLIALHSASLELVSDLSLDEVLRRIVTMARELAGAHYAALGVLDEQGLLQEFIPIGMSEVEIARMDHPPVGHGLIGAIQKECRTIRVPEISADPRRSGFPKHHPPMSSFLGVPIMLGDRLLGQIYLTDKEGWPEFTVDDALVIETLAAYAAVAINNAHLYQDLVVQDKALMQRTNDLALLHQISTALSGTLDASQILDLTLQQVMDYLDVEAGEIFLRDEDNESMSLQLHRGEAAEAFWTKDCFLPGEGFVGTVAQTGKPLSTANLPEDVRFLRQAVVDAGFRCLACVPLSARGSVIGVMGVATRKIDPLEERILGLLTSVGALAGIAIDNARLNKQARRVAILEERERIGMDLHDGVIQSIYAVGLVLELARVSLEDDPLVSREKIEQAIHGLNATIRDIRTYILDLRPRQFGGGSLMDSLRRLVEEFRINTQHEATLIGPEDGMLSLPSPHADALFHICQEAMANVAKHARARAVRIQLWTAPERVLLEISDNGRGFDLRRMSVTLGHGLSNMHTRARKVGGDVEITSEEGKGTTVLAWVPVLRHDELLQQK
jgi:signal transduction histidine kinase